MKTSVSFSTFSWTTAQPNGKNVLWFLLLQVLSSIQGIFNSPNHLLWRRMNSSVPGLMSIHRAFTLTQLQKETHRSQNQSSYRHRANTANTWYIKEFSKRHQRFCHILYSAGCPRGNAYRWTTRGRHRYILYTKRGQRHKKTQVERIRWSNSGFRLLTSWCGHVDRGIQLFTRLLYWLWFHLNCIYPYFCVSFKPSII